MKRSVGLRSFDVEVNPLMIAGSVGKVIDARLGDLEPVADGDLLAEASKVTELLDQLGRLEARGPEDRIDNPDAAKLKELEIDPNGTKVTVTAQPRAAEGDTPPPPRTFTFVIGISSSTLTPNPTK